MIIEDFSDEIVSCPNKPMTVHGVRCDCGSMLSGGKRIYCYKHEFKEVREDEE